MTAGWAGCHALPCRHGCHCPCSLDAAAAFPPGGRDGHLFFLCGGHTGRLALVPDARPCPCLPGRALLPAAGPAAHRFGLLPDFAGGPARRLWALAEQRGHQSDFHLAGCGDRCHGGGLSADLQIRPGGPGAGRPQSGGCGPHPGRLGMAFSSRCRCLWPGGVFLPA